MDAHIRETLGAAGGPPQHPSADETIVDLFDRIARLHTDRPALRDDASGLSYGELAASVRRISSGIRALAAPGPVAVLAPHDMRGVAAVMGVLASARPVVPLDADHPIARNQLIAAHAGAAAVLTAPEFADQVRTLFPSEIAILDLNELVSAPEQAHGARPGPDDVAYIIYTSGSTGTPKGVFQTHRGLVRDILQAMSSFDIGPGDRLTLFYPPAVIAGLRMMLSGLSSGAAAHILRPRELGARELARRVEAERLTNFRSSATLFRHVANAIPEGRTLSDIRIVALGGDRVDWSDFDSFRRVCPPGARFASHLGATECSLYLEWFADPAARGQDVRLPVGRPMPGCSVWLLDEHGRPAEEGEFVVSSPFVTLGYWRDPERTARAFAPPDDYPDRPAFHTGDFGRRRPDGLYEMVGRRDDQIKLRGFRVELGEVESALRACPGVRDGAVLVRRSAAGEARALAAYVELSPGTSGLLGRHLKAMLTQRLPAHMIPAEILIVPELPWLANFKIDRSALAAMDLARLDREGVQITDPTTAEVARAFEASLGVEGATAEDNLLTLGGDSLKAVDVILELERRLGVPIPSGIFESCSSIQDLAAWIAGRGTSPTLGDRAE
jgi:amino acid adenylation domain-containing protein